MSVGMFLNGGKNMPTPLLAVQLALRGIEVGWLGGGGGANAVFVFC